MCNCCDAIRAVHCVGMASVSGIKRDALDAIFSDCVRLAANCCEAHGEPMLHGNIQCSDNLECAHIHGRRYQIVRHDPMNAVSLCGAHHRWYTDHPVFFTQWLNRHLGPEHLDILREKLQTTHKWLNGMKAEARKHYRNEYKLMVEQRSRGATGKLKFVGYL